MPFLQRRSLLLAALLLPATAAFAQTPAGPVTLTFDRAEMAGISGMRAQWDAPVPLAADGATEMAKRTPGGEALRAVWLPEKRGDRPGAPVFDAVHRSLLVRFPGAAKRIAAEMGRGYAVQRVELELPFRGTELWPEGYLDPAGMSFLGDQWAKWTPRWHAVAWALRRPWIADARVGPTFNSFIHGSPAYWAKYGAQDERSDRFPHRFGPGEVSAERPEGRVDVTASLTDPAFGADPAERLQRLEDCGFLVRKWEVYDAALWQGSYEWQTATGPRGILIGTPRLLVTLAPGAKPVRIPAKGLEGGMVISSYLLPRPTAVLPSAEEIARLARRLSLARPAGMPDWQWRRVEELYRLGGGQSFPSTPAEYAAWVDRQLGTAPRRWSGFDAAERVEEFFRYREAMPAPVQDHWKLYWWAWLMPDRAYPGFEHKGARHRFAQGYIGGKEAQAYYRETGDWRGNFSVYRTYVHDMGTMNFNNWSVMGVLGGGAILQSPRMIDEGTRGLETFSFKMWSWFDGTTQESIDHYYFAESLTAQKGFQDWAPTPMAQIMGESIVGRSVEELASCYHPGLRRFISPSGRTGIAYLLGIQDGLQHVVHTLSPRGALTDLAPARFPEGKPNEGRGAISAPNVENMPVLGSNLKPGRVAEQAVNSPWAPEWVSGIVDDKPLPYEVTAAYKQWGNFSATPLWKRSYLGRHYGLATLDVSIGNETVPLMAQWRRADRTAESMTEIGTLLARAGINRTELLDSIYHDTKQRNPNGSVGTQGHTQFALQHRNKAIVLTSPTDPLQFPGGRPVPAEVRSLQTTIGLLHFAPETPLEVYVDGERVTQFPHRARLSQRIAVRDGLAYIGLIPLPATDLGRDEEVVIADDGVMTEMQGGGRAREALRIHLYNRKRETPLDPAQTPPAALSRAFNGFVIEMGDAAEYGDFAAFQKHLAAATLEAKPDDSGVAHVRYRSGPDLLECGFNPAYAGDTNRRPPTTEAFPYRRVNGAWPYNPPDIERDTTLTAQGITGRLEKSGAVLTVEPGRMAYLQTEPKAGVYSGSSAFSDLTPFSLTVPGGVSVKADGRLGMARVTVRPGQNRVWVRHALRPEQVAAPGIAKRLLVFGPKTAPLVEVNGKPHDGLKRVTVDGAAAWAVPL